MASFNWSPLEGGSGGGVTSINTLTGDLTLAAGTGITITPSGDDTLTIASTSAGDLTLTAFGSTPNADGASLSAQALTLQPADGTHPGGVSITSQTFGGSKTFSSLINADGGIDRSTSGTLTIGATNSSVINIGNSGATVNIQGNTIYENTPQLLVADPLITVNSGGGVGSGQNSGIEVNENNVITGYAETSSDRNSWTLKAPNTAGIATITPGASGITLDQSSHNPVTIGTANGLSLSTQVLSLALSSTSTTGALSSTDWNTFNSKQVAGNYITALTGDGTASGPGSVALTFATVNSNVGSFGSASSVGAFTVNAKGLVTAASSTSIQIAESQVTNLVSDLAGKQPTGSYITALTGDVTATGPGSVAASLVATTNSTLTTLSGLTTALSLVSVGTITTGTWNGTTIAIANGGTGQTTQAAAFNALSPITTKGDLIVGTATNTAGRLAVGSNGKQTIANSTQATGVTFEWTDSAAWAQNYSINAAVAANAMTISLNNKSVANPSNIDPVRFGFRSPTQTLGTYTQNLSASSTSLVIPSGATLGQVSATAETTYVYVILSTNPELAVSTFGAFDEAMVVTTTAISAAASSRTVLYSTTARTNVPVRLIGKVITTQASAGTWATSPSVVAILPFITQTPGSFITGTVPLATAPAAGSANGAVVLDGSANFTSVAPGSSGNVLTSNGTSWASSAPTSGVSLLNVLTFTTPGAGNTYTKNASASHIVVTVVGGGAGSGGTAATSTLEAAAAGGGGGGGTSVMYIANTSIGATETVTVGAGGTAATAGNNNGGNGGTSSFGAFCSATGGSGGSGSPTTTTSTAAAGGAAGAGSGGTYNLTGGDGNPGRVISGTAIATGGGGNSTLGGASGSIYTSVGRIGNLYGGGASGSVSGASTGARAGAAGAQGIVIVYEYA